MVGGHHQFNGHKLGQTPEDGEGQGGRACCSLWGCKKADPTERLENNSDPQYPPSPPSARTLSQQGCPEDRLDSTVNLRTSG